MMAISVPPAPVGVDCHGSGNDQEGGAPEPEQDAVHSTPPRTLRASKCSTMPIINPNPDSPSAFHKAACGWVVPNPQATYGETIAARIVPEPRVFRKVAVSFVRSISAG